MNSSKLFFSIPAAIVRAVLLLTLLQPFSALSQDINALKAAYIFYFSKFVSWQQEIGDAVVVCVDTNNEALVRQLKGLDGKAVADKQLRIREFDLNAQDAVSSRCHVLYSDNDGKSLQNDLSQVLVITDSMMAKSIVVFRINDGKLSFDIDAGRAEANNIRISSKLLQLANRVYR